MYPHWHNLCFEQMNTFFHLNIVSFNSHKNCSILHRLIAKYYVCVFFVSGVGKTSLVHLICHNEPTSNPNWTIGCSVEVKVIRSCNDYNSD